MTNIFILICTQILFTTTDLIGRNYMNKYGFKISSFVSLWFFVYLFLKIIAILGQLYIFSEMKLGKTMALFGAVSIILSNSLGFLILKEFLTINEYIGIILAISAFMVLSLN